MRREATRLVRDAIGQAKRLLGRPVMNRVWFLTTSRVLVSSLDLFGVFLLSEFTSAALDPKNLGGGTLPVQWPWRDSPISTLLLALTALSIKSISSLILGTRQTRLLNSRATELIQQYSKELADSGYETTAGVDSHLLHYQLTAGMRAGSSGIILPLSSLVSEGSLLVLFFLFLVLTNAPAAILSVVILGLTSRQLYRYLSYRQYRNGQLAGSATIRSLSYFQEAMHGYRELYVRGSLRPMLDRFGSIEAELSELQTSQAFLGNVPRHVLETVVMLSLGVIAGVTILLRDIDAAILLITVFGAATARILPSLVPLQASLSELQSNVGKSNDLRDFLTRIRLRSNDPLRQHRASDLTTEQPTVVLDHVTYRYPGTESDVLNDVSLAVTGVGWYAVDGPSGSGKSTLLDVLIGLRMPTAGEVTIDGFRPTEFVQANPGKCAYLPQRVSVLNATLAENVALGSEVKDGEVERLLRVVGLGEVLDRSVLGVHTRVGELGHGLSGGQLQRLGIARCLYTNPEIILLDESTTGLDEATKSGILDLLSELSKSLLVISISHDRDLTARAGHVFRISAGRIVVQS